MAIEKPTWTYKSKGDKQTASEMNELAQAVITNAIELSNTKDDIANLNDDITNFDNRITSIEESETVKKEERNQPNGYAGLDSSGKIPIERIYGATAAVTDVAAYELLPATGSNGVIYNVLNTGSQYKWSGSAYVDITDGADNAKKNETSIFDCSNGTSTKYYSSLSDAINVVPVPYRTSNRIISYLSTEGSAPTAVNYQYYGIDNTTWTNLTKWARIPNQADLAEIRSDLSEIEINKLDKSSLSSLIDLDSENNVATSRAVKLINDRFEQFKDGGLDDGSIELPKLSPTLAAYIGSGGQVNNQADDDDLENAIINGVPVIREKTTKAYTPETYSGMGRVILRKNMVNGVNVLTQETINQANAIYEIRYDFDLNGNEITIPEGCVLDFQGGSLNNGNVIGNNTAIKAELVKIFGLDINLLGSLNIAEAYPEWFGAKGDMINDDTLPFQCCVNVFKNVTLNNNYKVLNVMVGTNTAIQGNGHTILHSENAAQDKTLFVVRNSELIIDNVIFDGNYDNTTPSEYNIGYWSLLQAGEKGSLKVYNSILKNTRGNAITLGGVYTTTDRNNYAHDCIVKNCKIYLYDNPTQSPQTDMSGDAILIEKCHNVLIENCDSIGGMSGFRCQSYCKNVKIINNRIYNVTRDVGITVAFSEHIIIDGNTIINTCIGIEIDSVYDCVVSDNIVKDHTTRCLITAELQMDINNPAYFGYITDELTDVPGNYQNAVNPAFPMTDLTIINNKFINGTNPCQFVGFNSSTTISQNYFETREKHHAAFLGYGVYRTEEETVFSNNIFVCPKDTPYALGFYGDSYQNTPKYCRGNNNTVVGAFQLAQNPMIGENNIYQEGIRITNYVDGGISVIKHRINGTVFGFKTLPSGYYVFRFVARADIADNETLSITFGCQEWTAGDEWIKNIFLNVPIQLTNKYQEFIYYFVLPTPNSYDNKYLLSFNGANNLVDCYYQPLEIYSATKLDSYNNPLVGATSTRNIVQKRVGDCFFDTTLGKPIYWNGTAWVDATGATV